MTPLMWGKLILVVAVGGIAFWGALTVKGWRDDAIHYKAVSEEQGKALEAAQGVSDALEPALEAGRLQEQDVGRRVAASEARFKELRNEDPTVDAWAAQPIPQRLRDDARARRLEHGSTVDPNRSEAPDGKAGARRADPAS